MTQLAVVDSFTKAPEFDLEGGLARLCEYGKPWLSSRGNGEWYCSLEMFVQGKGVEFQVKSDFNCKSPLAAVRMCHERLEKALKDLGV